MKRTLIILIFLLGFISLCFVVSAGLIDFTTWTEVDGGNDLTVTTNEITINTMIRDVENYVYYDYGIDYWGDFTNIKLQVEYDMSDLIQNCHCCVLGMTNDLNCITLYEKGIANKFWDLNFKYTTANPNNIQIILTDNFDDSNDIYNAPKSDTIIWLIFSRSGNVISIEVYTDEYITLVDTLTTTLNGDSAVNYRYLHTATSYGGSGTGTWDGWIRNLDIPSGITNYPPNITINNPLNNSVDLCPCCLVACFSVSDNDSNYMNITYYSNITGGWEALCNLYNKTNGTYAFVCYEVNLFNTTYFYYINVSDGDGNINSTGIYNFKTTSNILCGETSSDYEDEFNLSISLCFLAICLAIIFKRR